MKWFWQAIKHLYDISYSEYAEPLVKYSSDIPNRSSSQTLMQFNENK